jgi:hypothetical protein
VKGRIKESIYGVSSEIRSAFSAGRPSPEVTLPEYKAKDRAKDLGNGETLQLASAESCQSIFEQDGFAECLKFREGLDSIVFVV